MSSEAGIADCRVSECDRKTVPRCGTRNRKCSTAVCGQSVTWDQKCVLLSRPKNPGVCRVFRSWRCQPAGRRVRQRAPVAGHGASADRRDVATRRPTVRHIATAARLTRLRQQDPRQVRRRSRLSVCVVLCVSQLVLRRRYFSYAGSR